MAAHIPIDVPGDLAAALDRLVAAGRFRSREEALQEAVRHLLQAPDARSVAALRRSYQDHPEDEAYGDIGLRVLAERVREDTTG